MNTGKAFIAILFITLFACGAGGPMDSYNAENNMLVSVPDKAWNALAGKRVYFGHMSVGYDIIDGMKAVMNEHPRIKLKILETADPLSLDDPAFAHSRNGKNMDQESKINAFKKTISSGMGKKADIAFFKFCYVDFTSHTDVPSAFKTYKHAMTELKRQYPDVMFIHMTVPLTTWKTAGIISRVKDLMKSAMGKMTARDHHTESNIKRSEFNALLKGEYGEKEVFDLAGYESTRPDGKREVIDKSKGYYALVPEYTYDGGHLNETGKKHIGQAMLYFLAGLVQ